MDNFEDETTHDDPITLTDQNGNQHDFQLVRILEVDDRDYAILLALRPETVPEWEDGDALIMRVDEEDGEDTLVSIEDEAEFREVVAAWQAGREEDGVDRH